MYGDGTVIVWQQMRPPLRRKRLEQRNRLNELEKELQTAQNLAQSAGQAATQARDKARDASDKDNQARTALRTAQADLAQKRQDLADLERGAAKHVQTRPLKKRFNASPAI